MKNVKQGWIQSLIDFVNLYWTDVELASTAATDFESSLMERHRWEFREAAECLKEPSAFRCAQNVKSAAPGAGRRHIPLCCRAVWSGSSIVSGDDVGREPTECRDSNTSCVDRL